MKTPWRKLYVLAIAVAFSWLGNELTTFSVILRDKDVIGPGGVSIYLLAFGIPSIVMAPIAGWITDRFTTRQVILPSLFVMGATSLSLTANLPIWWTPLALTISAFAATLVGPASQAAQVAVTEKADIPRVTGLMQSMSAAGMLFAPALGGILVATTGYFWPFVIDAISFWLLGVVFVAINLNRKGAGGENGQKVSLTAGFKFVFSDRLIRALLILVSVLVVSLSSFNVGEVFLIKDELHASTLIYGIVGALYAGGTILGSALTALIKLEIRFHALATVVAMTVLSFTILGFSQVGSWFVAMLLALTTGVASAFLNTYAIGIIMSRSPEESLGRVNAVVQAMINFGFVLGVIVSGVSISFAGVRSVLLVGGILSILTVVVFGPEVVRAGRNHKG